MLNSQLLRFNTGMTMNYAKSSACTLCLVTTMFAGFSPAQAHVGDEQGQCTMAPSLGVAPMVHPSKPVTSQSNTRARSAHPEPSGGATHDPMNLVFLLSLLLCAVYWTQQAQRRSSYRAHGPRLAIAGLCLLAYTSCKETNQTPTPDSPNTTLEQIRKSVEAIAGVQFSSDKDYAYIGSNGLPEHDMMVGITNWQQQIPIPQDYTGSNAWSIPLNPVLSNENLSIKNNFMKGAIAVAVNGIPIFNPLNNRGEDAFLIGELDQWGGHCGRADDYHYHLPPFHLQQDTHRPIAWALDGFPVYGSKEADGTKVQELDSYNGHMIDGAYHYHGTKSYPYMIGAMRGVVKFNPDTSAPENEIAPQAKSTPVRRALEPLRDAAITTFTRSGPAAYTIAYTLNDEEYGIRYAKDGATHSYVFVGPDGTQRTETYP